jgi:hypothetical protein
MLGEMRREKPRRYRSIAPAPLGEGVFGLTAVQVEVSLITFRHALHLILDGQMRKFG